MGKQGIWLQIVMNHVSKEMSAFIYSLSNTESWQMSNLRIYYNFFSGRISIGDLSHLNNLSYLKYFSFSYVVGL